MKYIMTFLWSVLLVSMLNYVVSSVNNVPFILSHGLIMSILVAIMIFIITAIIPNELQTLLNNTKKTRLQQFFIGVRFYYNLTTNCTFFNRQLLIASTW